MHEQNNIFKHSFWNTDIDDWNSLPNNVAKADNVSKFKKLLYKYLSPRYPSVMDGCLN